MKAKTQKTLIAIGLGAALVAAAAAPAVARAAQQAQAIRCGLLDTPVGRFLTGQIGRLLVLRSRLDVTPEQRTKILAIVRSHRAELARAAKPVTAKRRALREATLAEPIDPARIRAAAEELGKALGDLAIAGARVKAEVKRELSEEQRRTLREFCAENDKVVDAFLDRMANAQ